MGKPAVNYKLRDWVFSRQRYWGEPFPIVHCEKCGTVGVPEDQLPVRLPEVERYEPTGTGESPLAAIKEWVNTACPQCGGPARRETNTMPQWAGSCWYFLRYTDPKNDKKAWDEKNVNYWMPVDLYVGGAEHAVLHLLYSRFWTKFLYDIGVVNFKEPFKKLFNQGIIYRNGAKMSKSKGNVVNPDELVETYGADSLRLYELFIGPPEVDSEWDDHGIEGVFRFLNRVWRLVEENKHKNVQPRPELVRQRHRFIAEVTRRLEDFRFNTAVSSFMSYVNFLQDENEKGIDRESLENLVVLLSPFAPHIAEELWQRLGHTESVFVEGKWPSYDPKYLEEEEVTIVVQVNGKLRETFNIRKGAGKEEVSGQARKLAGVAKVIEGKQVIKEIFVPDKLINFVVK